jgi:type I restriction enzyme S subunit
MIRTTNVRHGFIDTENVRYVTEATFKKWTRRLVPRRGDVILTREAPLGDVGKMRTDDQIFLGQRLYHFRPDPRKLDADFLLYALMAPDLQGQIRGFGSGSTVEHMRLGDIPSLEIDVPPVGLQRRIGRALSAYDELMENCQRRIRILEEMARLIYREWFVYFRFPGHEKIQRLDSPLGPIPHGWQVSTVEELVKRLPVGKKYDQKTATETGAVPVLDQGKSGVIGYHDDEPGVKASEAAPVIVFANHTCYQRLVHFPFSAIQNVLPFVPNPGLLRNIYWLNWATNGLVVFNDYKGHWPEFAAKTLVVPPADICERFGRFAAPLARQTLKLERTVANLRRTRDLLLPRLLSGQVSLDVSAVEDVAEPTAPAPPLSQTALASEKPALRAAEEAPPYRVERAGKGPRPPTKHRGRK